MSLKKFVVILCSGLLTGLSYFFSIHFFSLLLLLILFSVGVTLNMILVVSALILLVNHSSGTVTCIRCNMTIVIFQMNLKTCLQVPQPWWSMLIGLHILCTPLLIWLFCFIFESSLSVYYFKEAFLAHFLFFSQSPFIFFWICVKKTVLW